MSDPTNEEGWTWAQQACSYAKNWGWNVLPLSPRVGTGKDADPVIKRLGTIPLVDPEKASSDPEVIKGWGNRFEEVEIGIATGADSGVLAVEVMTGDYEGGEEGLFHDRLLEVTGGHCKFESGGRAYLLIPHAHVDVPLPPMTERRGAVLHGEGSVVYAPWSLFRWADDHLSKDRGPSREVVEIILTMFRVGDHLAPEPEEESPEKGSPDEESSDEESPKGKSSRAPSRSVELSRKTRKNGENGHKEEGEPPLPWQREEGAGETPGGLSTPSPGRYFRSGKQLRCARGREARFDLPWTVPGGLSVLTGPPKTAGKSSWVLSLASRLAAGDPFLGAETAPSKIVMLADCSPTTMRELLAWHKLPGEALSRLHIAHPEDTARAGWRQVLGSAFEHAQHVGADLLVIDCLDHHITFKGGPEPTESSRVIHQLTAEAPSDFSILSVKSTPYSAAEPLARTIGRLGMLGIGADAIVRLDDVSIPRFPCLRRVLTTSRNGAASQEHICALRSGRYSIGESLRGACRTPVL